MEITTRRAVFKSWERVALALFCSISIFAIGISVLVISVGQARQGFDTKVDGLYGLLSQALASSEAALTSFAGVYQASDGLSSTQFTLMSKRLRASYPQVQMSVYAEAIGVDERADFEAEMKANGFPDFSVKPVGADAASLNGRHLVLSYLDEMTPASAHLLGSDLATAVELGSALRHAVDDAAVVALSTDRFTTQGRNWVLLKSIYYGNIVPGSVRERRRQLQGLLIFVLDLEQLTQLGAERYPDLGWRLFARGGGVGPSQVLFEKHSTRRQTVRLPAESQNAAFSASRYFRVGRQSLALEVQAQPALVGIYVRAAATMLILGVVAFAVIVAMRSRRVARLEQDEAREALYLEREKA
ncbi:MAG: CHASE domain-containing protein [Pseudomonadota bacterium]